MKKTYLLAISFTLITSLVFSQEIAKPDFIKKSLVFEGSLGVNSNFYTSTNLTSRRPSGVTRFDLNAKLVKGRYFTIPITARVSTLPVHFGSFENEQSFSSFSFEDFVINPINNVSTGVHYKDFKLDIGTINAKLTKLTMSGVPMFGAGLNFNHGRLIFGAYSGISQHAIQSDTARSVSGQFQRDMQSIRIGAKLGKEKGSHFALNLIHGKDDSSSVSINNGLLEAQQGIVASVDFGIKFGKSTTFKSEIAASVFTSDEKSGDIKFENPIIDNFKVFPLKVSSFADLAVQTELRQSYKKWSYSFNGEYIGAGFRTMGQPFLQPDRLDVTIAPQFKMFKNKVNFNLNGGYRINNLVETKAATMTQIIMSSNISAQITEKFALAIGYSNFGIENNQVGDTIRIRNVTQAFNFSPSYSWNNDKVDNVISVNTTFNNFEDFNIVSGSLNSNNSIVYAGTYSKTFKKIPLNLSAVLTQFDLTSTQVEVHSTNASLVTGYKFFKKKLNTSLTSTYSINRSKNPGSDNQLTFRLTTEYTTPTKLSINLSVSNNQYNYAATSGLAFYRENLVNVGLIQKF